MSAEYLERLSRHRLLSAVPEEQVAMSVRLVLDYLAAT